jgi:hypothetical protein
MKLQYDRRVEVGIRKLLHIGSRGVFAVPGFTDAVGIYLEQLLCCGS